MAESFQRVRGTDLQVKSYGQGGCKYALNDSLNKIRLCR